MKHLGIDYGTKRIGLAVSDETGSLAFPLTTIHAGESTLSEVEQIIKKEKIEKIVLGESNDFKGSANAVMEDVEQFKKDLEELSGLEVVYEQELFSSALAARQFAPEEKSRKANPSHEGLDASAAAVILQSYLDRAKI